MYSPLLQLILFNCCCCCRCCITTPDNYIVWHGLWMTPILLHLLAACCSYYKQQVIWSCHPRKFISHITYTLGKFHLLRRCCCSGHIPMAKYQVVAASYFESSKPQPPGAAAGRWFEKSSDHKMPPQNGDTHRSEAGRQSSISIKMGRIEISFF